MRGPSQPYEDIREGKTLLFPVSADLSLLKSHSLGFVAI